MGMQKPYKEDQDDLIVGASNEDFNCRKLF